MEFPNGNPSGWMSNERLIALVQSAKQGDNNALGTLLASFQPTIFKVAMMMLNNHEDALDVYQGVCLLAKRHMSAVREPGRFAGWVKRTAVNLALAHRARRERNHVEFMEPDTAYGGRTDAHPAPVDDLIKEERAAAVRTLVASLSEFDQQVLTLCFFEDHTLDEVGEILHIPKTTLKPRLHRAKQRLRGKLVQCGLNSAA